MLLRSSDTPGRLLYPIRRLIFTSDKSQVPYGRNAFQGNHDGPSAQSLQCHYGTCALVDPLTSD